MKKILAIMLFTSTAFAQTLTCEVKTKSVGTYYNQCPVGTLSDGVDVRIWGSPQFPSTTVIVRCVKPVVVCTQATEGQKPWNN